MSAERGETTALVVAIPEAEPVVGPWRNRYCADAVARGIPPHITILVPLVPRTEVDDALLGSLRALFAPIPPFTYELARLESFPGVAWLAPEPSAPFHDLIERTCSSFSDHPPYGDPALEPVPHCTIGVDDDPLQVTAMLDELRALLAPELPIRCRASSVDLLEEREDGTWTLRASFLLQGPP